MISAPAIPACFICAAFGFDKLKIDRSFARSIEKAADAVTIVHAIVSLGRGLGMQVTAEGVEAADQQLFLRAAGVHSMHGFRFGRPVTVAEISMRLQSPGCIPARRSHRACQLDIPPVFTSCAAMARVLAFMIWGVFKFVMKG